MKKEKGFSSPSASPERGGEEEGGEEGGERAGREDGRSSKMLGGREDGFFCADGGGARGPDENRERAGAGKLVMGGSREKSVPPREGAEGKATSSTEEADDAHEEHMRTFTPGTVNLTQRTHPSSLQRGHVFRVFSTLYADEHVLQRSGPKLLAIFLSLSLFPVFFPPFFPMGSF